MTHRVRTAFGVSRKSITQSRGELWSGVGQGSGSSSPIWIVIELTMISDLKKYSQGIRVSSPDRLSKFHAVILGYIDDNNIISTYDENTTEQEIQDNITIPLEHGKGYFEQLDDLSCAQSVEYSTGSGYGPTASISYLMY